MGESALVSIVMPTYKFQYFETTLDSVMAQTYPTLELIICDDSPDGRIAELVEQKRAGAAFPIRYFKNEIRLGELGSTAKGIHFAEGKYIKFLHDDDVLEPECITELVAAMEREPDVALASSRRQRIDEQGEPISDILATCFPFTGDVILDGKELVSFLGDHTINFIGEPSCVLARRDDLLDIADQLMSLNGKVIHWVGDLALYAKLLQRGNLAFLSRPLTKFRVSTHQFSQQGRDQSGIGKKGHADFRQAIRDLGWYRASEDNRFVRVAPITQLKARVFKPVNLVSALQRAAGLGSVPLFAWLGERWPRDVQQGLIDQHLQANAGGPRIAVVVLDSKGEVEAIERTLLSLENKNRYRNLDVRVLSPLALPGVEARAEVLPLADGQEVAALNAAAVSSTADWLLTVEAGVEFTTSGLLIAALDLLGAPDSCLAVYADELMRLEDGEHGIALRPDLNLDLLLSFPAGLSRHWLLRRDVLLEQGGFAAECGEAFELDYQLRLIERHGLACIGHISEPLLASDAFALRDSLQERAVIERHLQARGYQQARVGSRLPGRYELDYGHAQLGSVSILIVVQDRLPQIQRCMETLLEHTGYTNYEVLLLDHGNQAPEMHEWLAGVEAMDADQLRVLRFDSALSRSALCNQAAQQARGDFLLWLGDGAGVMDKDWLQQLLNHGQRSEVGAVGGKLLSADGKVRHAGFLLGLCGPAGRAFEGASFDDSGYMQRLQVEQNYSALSGECLMIHREVFQQIGGFDEAPLLARWADVDLCLRLQQAGYLNVWTPRVQLLMDAPAEVAPTAAEDDAIYERWLPVMARDPAYNPGFSLQAEQGFKLADPQLSWQPLQSWRPLPVVLGHHADREGCGHYRMIQPFNAMRDAGLIEGHLSMGLLSPAELARYAPDVVVLQRAVLDEQLEKMRRMQAFSEAFKIFELDDYLPNLPIKSIHRLHMPKDILRSLRRGLGYVDRFVVSTQPLAEAFSGLHGDIRVIENRLPVGWWKELQSERRAGAKPRVGWAGGAGHTGDLELIADVVKELADEVEWVFLGMCPDKLRPYVHEFHAGVFIHQYPSELASLNLDLALAPLEQNLFNECKSNLRLLEYGACGYPVICSDVRSYQDGLPVTRVKNRFRDWVDAIRSHISDLDAAARAGDELRAVVLNGWMLEAENLEAWRKAWLPD
ncbi:glycosyltransferase [Stutzerimonas nitrititolerans]|uniref:glycosyltransferase n=1 Tax=Stutzerimonas nitrititolerans TaxID=2482751 RepID=UPI0007187578|nr:glycosyltransferase [Stutzerimonas nitrititolerans]KRW72745.1 O-antigen biosynthesis protein [Pseudomonas sp. TTU2014-066ASC]